MSAIRLTAREYELLLAKQNGMCCVRGCKNRERLIAEHSTPKAIWPRKPDQLMCTPCHKVKTRGDMKLINKLKRLSGRTLTQYDRRKLYGPTLRGPGFPTRGRK